MNLNLGRSYVDINH